MANTSFQHKYIHKCTREAGSRKKLIIDCVQIDKNHRSELVDIRAQRGYEIYSNQTKIRIQKEDKREVKSETRIKETIWVYNLAENEIREKYNALVEKGF